MLREEDSRENRMTNHLGDSYFLGEMAEYSFNGQVYEEIIWVFGALMWP